MLEIAQWLNQRWTSPVLILKQEPTTETRNDIKAAADILDARKKAMEDIVAGRPAPYFFAPSPHPTNGAEPAKQQRSSGNQQAHPGIWRYFESTVWIIAFLGAVRDFYPRGE